MAFPRSKGLKGHLPEVGTVSSDVLLASGLFSQGSRKLLLGISFLNPGSHSLCEDRLVLSVSALDSAHLLPHTGSPIGAGF